jgi:hypothetical protein
VRRTRAFPSRAAVAWLEMQALAPATQPLGRLRKRVEQIITEAESQGSSRDCKSLGSFKPSGWWKKVPASRFPTQDTGTTSILSFFARRSSLVARCSFSHFCYEERGEGSKRTSVLRSRQSLISALELLLLILLHGTHARARAHAHTHPHPHPTAWSDIVSAMTRNSP